MAQYMKLDWRQVVAPNDLIQKIDAFLTSFDVNAKFEVHSVNSTRKRLVTKDESGFSHDMVLQRAIKNVKRYQGGDSPSASGTDKYIGRMLVIAEMALKFIDEGAQNTPRNIWYKLQDGAFTNKQVGQMYKDLALTIQVHPYNLGSVPEVGKSFVRVPSGVKIRCYQVSNIFKLRRNDSVPETRWSGGEYRSIPPMVQSIKVEGAVRAVVISEHRSIKDKLDRHAKKPGFQGILLVLTGGFPDAACREFIHLLAVNPALEGVPFVWMSDCDAHSLQMYSTIKYGSIHQAYASHIMVCPQLIFGGVTMEKFEKFHRTYPTRYVNGVTRRTGLSEERQARLLSEKKLFVEERLKRIKSCSSGRMNRGDRQRIAGLRKAKTMTLAGEELALKQLDTLEAGGTKVSFVQLDEFSQDGVALFIAEQIAAIRDEPLKRPALFGDWSQTRALWGSSSSQTAQVEGAEELIEEEEEEAVLTVEEAEREEGEGEADETIPSIDISMFEMIV